MARLRFVAISAILALIGVGCTSAPATQVSQPPPRPVDSPSAAETPATPAPSNVSAVVTAPEPTPVAAAPVAAMSESATPSSDTHTAVSIASEPTAETSYDSSDDASSDESDEIDCGARENACNAACLSANRRTSRIFLPEVADQAYDFTLPSVGGIGTISVVLPGGKECCGGILPILLVNVLS